MDEANIRGRLLTLKKYKSELQELIDKEKKSLKEFEENIIQKGITEKNIIFKQEIVSKVSEVDPGCIEVEVEGMSVVKRDEYLNKRDSISDKDFFVKIKDKLDKIPNSNGSRYYNKLDVRIGIVADEFLFNSLKDAANFIYITPDNYKENEGKIDIFFVATAWSGLNKEWAGLSNCKSRTRELIKKIISEYRRQGIKIAFYSKEDPVHYGDYVDLAAEADYIFTTEKAVVENYKVDCNTENVSVLSFGINPVYHNPIGMKMFKKQKEVLFSGSWYNKYPERNNDAIKIFDGVIDTGKELKLVDRNYNLNNFKYFFPEKYLKYIAPSIKHEYLQKLHKMYDWCINLNTIKYSESMYANRVYELQALGNIIFSNYSVGVNNDFPNVFIVNDKAEVNHIIKGFNEEEIYKHQILGIRRVMSKETAFDRVKQICSTIGMELEVKVPSVAIVVEDNSDEIIKMFNNQSYQFKTLVQINEFTEEIKEKFDIIAFFKSSRYYGKYYIEDMVNAFKYTKCNYITKDSFLIEDKLNLGIEHNYTNVMPDKYRSIFWSKSFKFIDLITYKDRVEIENGYSIDHFEYNEISKFNNTNMLSNKYNLSVIIAAYNNGEHLLSKCFNSLKRSSMFNEMEIIIVDDGSTDINTINTINYINQNYNNVKTYFFNDGGSGSASRPRNKGFEISTSKYITYLDPDNEAVNDGYYFLYNELNNNRYDIVCGNMSKLDKTRGEFDFYNIVKRNNDGNEVLIGDKKKFIVDSKFYSMSIQALIFNRKIIEENSLKMIEGVFGEDTIFFFELLMNSESIKVIDRVIHIYYAAVAGSSVNNITSKFFQRYIELEKVRIEKYTKLNLMEDYIQNKFTLYIVNWYFKKLKNVSKVEALDSIKAIEEILDLYCGLTDFKISSIKNFYSLCKNKKYEEIEKEYI